MNVTCVCFEHETGRLNIKMIIPLLSLPNKCFLCVIRVTEFGRKAKVQDLIRFNSQSRRPDKTGQNEKCTQFIVCTLTTSVQFIFLHSRAKWKTSKSKILLLGKLWTISQPWYQNNFLNQDWTIRLLRNWATVNYVTQKVWTNQSLKSLTF